MNINPSYAHPLHSIVAVPAQINAISVETEMVSSYDFDQMFGQSETLDNTSYIDVDMDEYRIQVLTPESPLKAIKSWGISTCLVLGIKYYDKNQQLLAIAMGHISSQSTHLIEEMLQLEVPNADTVSIVAAGRFNEDTIELDEESMEMSLYPVNESRIFPANPWGIPHDIFESESDDAELLKEYVLDKIKFSLKVGITENGEVFIADDSDKDQHIDRFVQYAEEDFLAFLEEDASYSDTFSGEMMA